MSEDEHMLNDDFELETNEDFGDIESANAKIKRIKAELTRIKSERQEYLDGWQRCKADALNARQEASRSAQKMGEILREELLHDIIPVLDSFDMATGSESWGEVSNGFRTGMEAVRNQLIEVLERHGIRRFGKIGDTFDPRLHEVAQETADAPGESGTVCKILRYGYSSNDGSRTLRPAHVILKK